MTAPSTERQGPARAPARHLSARPHDLTVAVVGGGPSGAALAAFLARAGVRVALFALPKRPPLVIGESLVPAVIPFLRELGVEDEIAGFSTFKPGATFTLREHGPMTFRFRELKLVTRYAYNSPRDKFDDALLGAAEAAGARVFRTAAKLVRTGAGDRVALADECLAATGGFLDRQPDWIVDASGRARVLARALEIPAVAGPRNDVALFAHVHGMPVVDEGHTHSDLLEYGWAWRIPLPGRVSLGFVVDRDVMRRFGSSNEEQYDAFLARDRVLQSFSTTAKRVTPVLSYNNYQLVTTRGVGPGWAMVGDAFGFIDPVFSSGMLVGLDGAKRLAAAILARDERAMRRYDATVQRHLRAWHTVVDRFYDGRMLTLFQVGCEKRHTLIGRLYDMHLSRHLPQVFTGEKTQRRYSVGLLNFMCRRGIGRRDWRRLEVRR
jgi:flavin-dependent dehydrogenase